VGRLKLIPYIAAVLAFSLGQPGCGSIVPERPSIKNIEIVERGSYTRKYRGLTVSRNGRWVYEVGTYAPKKIEQKVEGSVGKKEVERLLDELYKSRFFSMRDNYDNSNPAIRDVSTTVTTVHYNGNEYSVSAQLGAGPKELRRIDNELWSLKNNKPDEKPVKSSNKPRKSSRQPSKNHSKK